MTRPKPFSEDNVAAGPKFHFQVPPVIDPRIPTPDQSSSWYGRSAFNVGPGNKVILRLVLALSSFVRSLFSICLHFVA